MATVNLTDKRVRDLRSEGKDVFLWDARMPGFGVRVTPAGAKSFVLHYRVGRHSRRITVGRIDSHKVGLEQARQEAREMLRAIGKGRDPVAERRARRDAMTLGELLETWMDEHSRVNNRPATIKKNEALIRRNLGGQLGKTPAADVTDADVEKLKARLRAKPVEFNRCLSLLRAAFNFAVRRKLVKFNPTAPVRPYPEQPRERVLSGDELQRLAAALDAMEAEGWNRWAIYAVRLLAMTGWRISEIQKLRWADLRPDRCEALLVDTKTGTRWATISSEALAMLDRVPRKDGNLFIFSGRKKGQHLSYNAVADALNEACKRAGVEDVSPHVFRASAATAMAEAGASPFALRDIFGWKGLAMPARYVKRAQQSAREAVAQHGARTAAIMAGKPKAEVVEIEPAAMEKRSGTEQQ